MANRASLTVNNRMAYPMGNLIGNPMGDHMAHEWPARWDGMGFRKESHERVSTEYRPMSYGNTGGGYQTRETSNSKPAHHRARSNP